MTELDYTNEYLKRQLNLIQSIVVEYKKGEKSFSHLVNDLDALINILSQDREDFSDELRTEWWDLEQINAVLLDEKNPKNDLKEYEADILKCLSNISKLVEVELSIRRQP